MIHPTFLNKAAFVILSCTLFTPAWAEPINNSGLSAAECYQKDSGCTQFCGNVVGDLRYECFSICDRMLDHCLDTGDWTDSVRVNPGYPPLRTNLGALSATLLQMVMSLADTNGDGIVSDEEMKAVKERVYKGQINPDSSKSPAPVQ